MESPCDCLRLQGIWIQGWPQLNRSLHVSHSIILRILVAHLSKGLGDRKQNDTQEHKSFPTLVLWPLVASSFLLQVLAPKTTIRLD